MRLPDPPEVRIAAVAAALVMAFVAIPDPGLVAYAPEVVSTPVAPPTAIDGSTGSLAAIGLDVMADIRWRVVKPTRPLPSPGPATAVAAGCDPVAAALAQDGADSVSPDELAALVATGGSDEVSIGVDADCPTTGAVLSWYLNAQEQAIAERAEAHRRAFVEQQRVDRERHRLAAKRSALRRAHDRATARHAALRAAQRRAASKRAAAHRTRPVSRGSASSDPTPGGWRNAPIVTWYGPGFYGNRTACGVRYTRAIVGVAHRTLPCGTLVRFRWHGMTAVAPVIDRGPYASAAYVFDFSAALSCDVFKPKGISNSCFTRHDVQYQVVGKVNLKQYLAAHRR
jgi:hypothetical protein